MSNQDIEMDDIHSMDSNSILSTTDIPQEAYCLESPTMSVQPEKSSTLLKVTSGDEIIIDQIQDIENRQALESLSSFVSDLQVDSNAKLHDDKQFEIIEHQDKKQSRRDVELSVESKESMVFGLMIDKLLSAQKDSGISLVDGPNEQKNEVGIPKFYFPFGRPQDKTSIHADWEVFYPLK